MLSISVRDSEEAKHGSWITAPIYCHLFFDGFGTFALLRSSDMSLRARSQSVAGLIYNAAVEKCCLVISLL